MISQPISFGFPTSLVLWEPSQSAFKHTPGFLLLKTAETLKGAIAPFLLSFPGPSFQKNCRLMRLCFLTGD